MTAGVYAIRNTVNGRRYIGQSENIEKRIREHIVHLNSAVSTALLYPEFPPKWLRVESFDRWLRDWFEHGSDAFEVDVLEIIEDKQTRLARERWYILNTPSEYNKALKAERLRINYPPEDQSEQAS